VESSGPAADAPRPDELDEAQRARVGLVRWVKHVRDAFILGILVHLCFIAGDELTFSRLPANSFWLAPRGWGFFWQAMVGMGGITLFAVGYTFPAFMVRSWLGWALRATMFLLFVVFLSMLRAETCVGAVQGPTGFTFVRSYPFPSTEVSSDAIHEVRVRDTGTVRALSLRREENLLMFIGVWHSDSASTAELQRLVAALENYHRKSPKSE
jgi:hypothetical protein